jgi:hypothetical protein
MHFIRSQSAAHIGPATGACSKFEGRPADDNAALYYYVPQDFMLQLTNEEVISLRSHFVTSNLGRGGRLYLPYAFTEHGVAMLSSVLNSQRAVLMNILS